MDPKVAILGLACLGTVVLVRRDSVRLLALGMAAVWCEANLLYAMDALAWLPMVDLPIAIGAFVAWKLRKISVALVVICVARLMLHVIAPLVDFGVYAHGLNGLYLAALAVLSWEGGVGDAIMHACRAGLRRFRRLRMGLAASAHCRRSSHGAEESR